MQNESEGDCFIIDPVSIPGIVCSQEIRYESRCSRRKTDPYRKGDQENREVERKSRERLGTHLSCPEGIHHVVEGVEYGPDGRRVGDSPKQKGY
jgi:hypothetical protein